MTYVDDLYEPNDREPDEDERWAPGVVPINLDDVEKRLARLEPLLPPSGLVREDDKQDMEDLRELIGHDVPGLIADLTAARERIAGFEALEKREEWAVTPSRDGTPDDGVGVSCNDKADQAAWLARVNGAQAWRRKFSVHPWEQIDTDAPF
ncbi:hypothetical protein [Nonomuraea sp. NPDC050643]|uniref:hypothetical protein n=1 Tax=Nonomuraea sp. NPDC050643 TaxID=3155660 RepID=UPI0033DBBC22